MFEVDTRKVKAFVLSFALCIALLAIGVGIGTKLSGYYEKGREGSNVRVFINVGDSSTDEVEGKWTQVRVEKTAGRIDVAKGGGEAASRVLEFNEANSAAIFSDESVPINFLFVSKKSAHFDKMLNEFQTAADQLKWEKMKFVYVNADSKEAGRIIDYLGVQKEELPTVRIHSIPAGKPPLKYRPATESKTMDAKRIVEFSRAFLSDQLQPYYRSAPTPADWDKGAVKVLTGENFDRVVRLDASKNVLVDFYAPWCGHCKKLTPVWEELGQKYRDHQSILIAMMDGAANEVADLPMRAFPTIKLFPAGAGDDKLQGIEYLGPRTVDGFSKFLDSMVSDSKHGGVGAAADDV